MVETDFYSRVFAVLERRRGRGGRVSLSRDNREFLAALPAASPTEAAARVREPLSAPGTSRVVAASAPSAVSGAPVRAVAPAPQQPRYAASPPPVWQVREEPVEAPKPAEPLPLPDLNVPMEALAGLVSGCQRCPLASGRTQTVFGAGDPDAALMFIGEGPGHEEDRQGEPFVGQAGQLLTRIIGAMGFSREQVYIANIVKCRPPRNRNPEPAEAEACLPYLRRQIELVQPRVLVLLGAVPLRFLLGRSGVMRLRGRWLEYGGIPVMPTFHPSYLLRLEGDPGRQQEAKRQVWSDMQLVMQWLAAG